MVDREIGTWRNGVHFLIGVGEEDSIVPIIFNWSMSKFGSVSNRSTF